MKIWTCGSSPRSGCRNAWKWIKNVNGASRPSNFWNFFCAIQMSCRDWLPWTKPDYNTITSWQSNNQWSGGIAAHSDPGQKIPSAKIRWKRSRLDFLRSRRHSPYWLSSKWPNYQRGVLLIPAGAIEGKMLRAGRSRSGSCSCTTTPGSLSTCNPEETGLPGLPVSWSPTLFSVSGTVGLPPVPWLKKQLKFRHFSSDAEVIAAAETWLDGQPSEFFFWVVCKRYSNGLRSV